MLRVLQVVGKMDCGGAETLIMNVYRRIDRGAFQFDFLVHGDKEGYYDAEIIKLGGQIYHVPKPRVRNILGYLRALDTFFREHPYTVIHGHMDSTAALYLRKAKKYGAVIRIAHSHNISAGKGVKAWLTELSHRFISGVATDRLACATAGGRWLFGNRMVEAGLVRVVPNAIYLPDYRFDSNKREQMRQHLNLTDAYVLGHVGRFQTVKNHTFLLDIMATVVQKCPNAVLLLAGTGELQDEIRNRAEAMGLHEHVLFLGLRSDVADVMQAMDVFVFPSLYEGLPLVLIEAQASGLPCLVSDQVPSEARITDLLEYLPLDSPEKWAERALVAADVTHRPDTGAQIRSTGYDIEDVAQIWTGIYTAPSKSFRSRKRSC